MYQSCQTVDYSEQVDGVHLLVAVFPQIECTVKYRKVRILPEKCFRCTGSATAKKSLNSTGYSISSTHRSVSSQATAVSSLRCVNVTLLLVIYTQERIRMRVRACNSNRSP